ncbi:hypothetical protein [Ornithinimicrobium flavum]|uniref:hypothetical protein n=1 Tax=Ornithinimicrobium flavum TaxID=1288636 RepID=UPI00106FD0F0|nr:hypothetical protein [Ornithinimicrobium flavum]
MTGSCSSSSPCSCSWSGWSPAAGAGRAAEARRIRGGFGGPPGSSDVGPDLGPDAGPERQRAAVLSAQRQVLRGWVLVGAAAVWLLVALLTRLA